MSILQRWNTVRRHKFCVVCLTLDEHGPHGQTCPHKGRLACKCGSDRVHHKLLCSNNASHAVLNLEQSKNDDDEKGGKSKKKKSKKKSKKPSSDSSLPQVSFENCDSLKPAKKAPDMSLFADRLLLLVHTLLALSNETPDQIFRAKCRQHLDDDWLQKPIVLQCCMSTTILLDDKNVRSLTLSDSGSTLSFVS